MSTAQAIPNIQSVAFRKVQLDFEFQGKARVLNKHDDVTAALKAGTMTEKQARDYPWFLRLRNGEKREKHKLPVNDAEAIKAAKEILKAKGTSAFSDFQKERDAKRAYTLDELAAEWTKDGMPDSTGDVRKPEAIAPLTDQLNRALEWFGPKSPALVTTVTMREFATWRRAKCKENGRGTGNRSIDMELGALSCLCDWAKSMGKIDANPFGERPTFQKDEEIAHCHEFAADSDEDWHRVLKWFFTFQYNRAAERKSTGAKLIAQDAEYTLRLRLLGGWLAFTGLTGLRPEEPQFLFRFEELSETPGNPSKLLPGQIFTTRSGEKKMRVQRGKGGQNPFVTIHPALADFLTNWTAWLDRTFPRQQNTRALFPHPDRQSESIFSDGDFTPVIRRLTDACDALDISRLKPKGFGRAYYVRVRRSQGADDSIIASELGQTTNGKLIRDTYGNPEDMAGGALFDWLPEAKGKPIAPAWKILNAETTTKNQYDAAKTNDG